MGNLIIAGNQAITFAPAEIDFAGYDALIDRAKNVAAYIDSIELNDDNIKEVKQTLADARKVTDGLDKARKDLKKQVMGNFDSVEEQIKFLISIVDDADKNLRNKVRELEEQEREEKREALRDLWNKRSALYTFPSIIPNAFDHWLTPQHLNKTKSMKSCETEMTAWMEGVEKDIAVLSSMGAEYVAAYIPCLDITFAIKSANDLKETVEMVKASQEDEEVEEEPVAMFIVRGTQNIKFTEILLKTNEIKFERK